jgi:hypothetical protein
VKRDRSSSASTAELKKRVADTGSSSAKVERRRSSSFKKERGSKSTNKPQSSSPVVDSESIESLDKTGTPAGKDKTFDAVKEKSSSPSFSGNRKGSGSKLKVTIAESNTDTGLGDAVQDGVQEPKRKKDSKSKHKAESPVKSGLGGFEAFPVDRPSSPGFGQSITAVLGRSSPSIEKSTKESPKLKKKSSKKEIAKRVLKQSGIHIFIHFEDGMSSY